MVAHERLAEPRVTMEWLLVKPRSLSNLPAFLDLNGKSKDLTVRGSIRNSLQNFLFVFFKFDTEFMGVFITYEFLNIDEIHYRFII